MKVSVYIATSIDGFIARENGSIDWLDGYDGVDENEDYGYQEFIASIDAIVMGRNTFEKVLTLGDWPYGARRVVVLSNHTVSIPPKIKPYVEASGATPTSLLADLQQQGVRHVYLDGGKTIQSFIKNGLVHELIITRIPRLIGCGLPLFGALKQDVSLNHVSTRSFSNGLVQSKYRICT